MALREIRHTLQPFRAKICKPPPSNQVNQRQNEPLSQVNFKKVRRCEKIKMFVIVNVSKYDFMTKRMSK